MQRIIYLNNEVGYCITNVKAKQDLQKQLANIQQYDAEIICVFDMETNAISFMSKNFSVHLELMRVNYSSSFLNKIFNKLLPVQKPTLGLIAALSKHSNQIVA